MRNVGSGGWLAGSLVLGTALVSTAVSAPKPPPAAPKASTPVSLPLAAHGLLAKRCLQCHGAGKLSGLDLRSRAAALAGGNRGPSVVPGKPEESLLYRLAAGHGTPRMPPGAPLPAPEQELLRRWIAAGAEWPGAGIQGEGGGRNGGKHWAFRPVAAPPVPKVKNAAWVRNPIDAFVLAGLEARGLSPAPPASPRELIRRVTFDLTGLPPTPAEVEAFVRECREEALGREGVKALGKGPNTPTFTPRTGWPQRPNTSTPPSAYERLIDRLLASPRYGERWARHWLDVARFAESQGFERDKLRENAWPYRDYVIRALNTDKPYDRFIREQIAGDVLPDATEDSIAGTGFLVGGPWDEVGNTQASALMRARVREDELEDMVSATAQTFLGLTVNCARCHNHKFDPIPQRDYYRIQAALAGVRHGDRSLLPAAKLAENRQAAEQLRAEVRQLDRRLGERVAALRRPLEQARVTALQGQIGMAPPAPLARWTFDQDGTDAVGGLDASLQNGARVSNGRLELDGIDDLARTTPLPRPLREKTLEAWVRLNDPDQRGGSVLTVEDENGRTFDAIVFGEREPRKWMAGSEGFVRTRDLPAPGEAEFSDLVHVAITYDAENRITVFRNGKPYAPAYVPAGTALRTFEAGKARVQFGLRHSEGAAPRGGRWLKGQIEEARLYDRALSPAEVEASFRYGVLTSEQFQGALNGGGPEAAGLLEKRSQLAARAEALERVPLVYAANPQPTAPVFVLERGDVEKKGEAVAAGALSCLAPLNDDFGLAPDAPDAERRRKLADWIADPANPLTPRVLVNRVWQHHFGRGIVATPSDFGVMGEAPTHPELLDWLAANFVGGVSRPESKVPSRTSSDPGLGTRDSGLPQPWSLKSLHRLILLSNTYRQSAAFNPKAAAVDAENRLLWRMSPRRLEAEETRDAMLAISGQLQLRGEGPGFRPFSVVVANSSFYTYEDKVGPEYNARSIYRTVVNSGGIPLLEALDCPDPSVKTPRRGATTTPLQALSLLNSSFVLRQSAELAKRLEAGAGADPGRQVEQAYQLMFSRPPTAAEQARAAAFVREHGLPAFCRVLFNAGEFIYVR